jgi:hypothetical protein
MSHDDENVENNALSHWSHLDPKVKQAVRQSFAEWLAKEYAPPAETPPELRELLKRMEECEK